MIDNFALLISHGLLGLAFWRLMNNDAVDRDDVAVADKPDSTADA